MYIIKRKYQPNHIPIKPNHNNINKKVLRDKKERKVLFNDKKINTEISKNFIMIESLEPKFETPQKETFEEKFQKLEDQPLEFFESKYDDYDIKDIDNFLYHGIRFQQHLEKLESIFKDKAILAGNYHNKYYNYDDNCNEGEYISLTSYEREYITTYEIFIINNISLIISPECNAIKTIYLKYEDWEKAKGIKTNNRYSYAMDEYQVKEKIPLDLVKGIGLPANHLRETKREYLIDIYLNDILDLMKKYNTDLPIVDTSYNNRPLYTPKNYQSKRKILKNK